MTRATDQENDSFAALLDLAELEPGHYQAPPSSDRDEGMYGGQLLAQSLLAAYRTIGEDRHVHSLQAYFLRAGDDRQPLDLHVENIRDGRSFSFRSVEVSQNDKEIFRMTLSFQIDEEGPEYAGPAMPDVPPPDEVSFTYIDFYRLSKLEKGMSELPASDSPSKRPMDIRYIDHPTEARGVPILDDQRMWMRIPETLEDRAHIHYAGLVYLCDSSLIDIVALPHGRRWYDQNATGVSLAHSMWFYQRPRADEWLLFDQRAEATGNNRGLSMGRIYDRSGTLIATASQEGMIRWRDE